MLIDKLLFSDRTPKILKKSLDFHSQRHLLVSSNISNLDTPGYLAKDLDFKSQLKEVMGQNGEISMKKTHRMHMGIGSNEINSISANPFEISYPVKNNGNNVNIDNEMMKLAENQIAYNAAIQLMSKRGSTIRAAVTETAQG